MMVTHAVLGICSLWVGVKRLILCHYELVKCHLDDTDVYYNLNCVCVGVY